MINIDALDTETVLRLLASLLCGVCIGINRDLHHKPAGFRTFALVGVGSALVTLVAVRQSGVNSDAVSRVIQGVLTGIGFVGAGVIFHSDVGRPVKGLTTAAAVWLTAGLGVACGLGRYLLAGTATVLALLILIIGGPIERRFDRLLREKMARDRASGNLPE